jgi:hypothetical protein
MVEKTILDIVAVANLLLALATLYFCGRVIWVHILRQKIKKKFVNIFYIFATLICFSIIGTSITVLMLTDGGGDFELTDTVQEDLGAFSILIGIHSVSYMGLVLLMITTMLQITIGLKSAYNLKNDPDARSKARKHLISVYLGCLAILAVTIMIEIFASGVIDLKLRAYLAFYLALAIILAAAYIFSLCNLLRYMNTAENPALAPEY